MRCGTPFKRWHGAAKSMFLLSLFLWVCGYVAVASAEPVREGTFEIKFKGSSTLHDFEGSAGGQPFAMRVVKDQAGATRWSGVLRVKVADMTTANSDRDKNMQAMFRSDKFPIIEAKLTDVNTASARSRREDGKVISGVMPIQLTISGETRSVSASVVSWEEQNDQIEFRVKFPVSLKAFKLEAPSAFLGLVRVGDQIDVEASVKVRNKPEKE